MSNYKDCYTVSKLNELIKNLLDGEFFDVIVKGEISNFHHHPSSGHIYFTLKDDNSEIRCTMFRSSNLFLKFDPKDGMEVRVYGSVSVYTRKGQIQLKVLQMESSGLGDLFRLFEELKNSLEKKGFFDPINKKVLPNYPKKIGLVTSGSSAAYKDITNVINRRAPHVNLLLCSVKVQGERAAEEIVSGIELLNQYGLIDLIIVARGGGSIEDLWPFNEEIVAHAIFNSNIPIITGVGHETDFTIADFVADFRAPTPSAAAEIAVPNKKDVLTNLGSIQDRIFRLVENQFEQAWSFIDKLESRVANQKPTKKIHAQNEMLYNIYRRLLFSFNSTNDYFLLKLKNYEKQILSLGPDQVLERGYAIPFDNSNQVIRSSKEINVGESFRLKMARDEFIAEKKSNIQNKSK